MYYYIHMARGYKRSTTIRKSYQRSRNQNHRKRQENFANSVIATNRSWKEEDGTIKTQVDFHNIICWGRKAEVYGEYLKKGKQVLILGRIENKKYIKDNVTRTYSQIVANDIIMLDKKPTDQPDQEQEAPTEDIKIESDETEPMPF